jgi:hypothetical protein
MGKTNLKKSEYEIKREKKTVERKKKPIISCVRDVRSRFS